MVGERVQMVRLIAPSKILKGDEVHMEDFIPRDERKPKPILNDIERLATDLAPGDKSSARFDFSGLELLRIAGPDDPLFERAYRFLWDEFGARNEVEQRDVIVARLRRDPARAIDGYSFLYEMIAVVRSSDGALAAVRDHTAIVPRAEGLLSVADASEIVVHLSHLLIAWPWRGSGLAGWMRALPVQTARRAARQARSRRAGTAGITLLAEMEPADPAQIDTLVRLKSYRRAGFAKVDPLAIAYRQPDFRPFAEIDATGVRPLPMSLILRRVGRERETSIGGEALRHLVRSIYAMYAQELRRSDLAELVESADRIPENPIRLISPIEA